MDKPQVYTGGVRVYIPQLTSLVIPDLNAFLVVLSHLSEHDQIDILQQATLQISEVLEGGAL